MGHFQTEFLISSFYFSLFLPLDKTRLTACSWDCQNVLPSKDICLRRTIYAGVVSSENFSISMSQVEFHLVQVLLRRSLLPLGIKDTCRWRHSHEKLWFSHTLACKCVLQIYSLLCVFHHFDMMTINDVRWTCMMAQRYSLETNLLETKLTKWLPCSFLVVCALRANFSWEEVIPTVPAFLFQESHTAFAIDIQYLWQSRRSQRKQIARWQST